MKRVLAATLLAVATATVFGTPVIEPEVVSMIDAVGERIIVQGTLNRYGSEPHTFLGVLVSPDSPPVLDSPRGRVVELDDERVFELEGELASELNRFQGQRVTVRGVLSRAPKSALPPPVIRIESYTLERE